MAGVKFNDTWKTGIDTVGAVFINDNSAIRLDNNHKVTFGVGGSIYGDASSDLNLYSSDTIKNNSAAFEVMATGEVNLYSLAGSSRLRMWRNVSADVVQLESDYISLLSTGGAGVSLTGTYNPGNPDLSDCRLTPSFSSLNGYVDLGESGYRFRKLYCRYIRATSLPTSTAGLYTGDFYRDGNTVKVVV
jgi:hypothetical protein